MGLDTTHDCFHGAYSAFHRLRLKWAEVADIPLELMEGFYGGDSRSEFHRFLPIKWSALKPDALHDLLHHSDCDGELPAEICGPLADRLTEILPLLDGDGGGHIGDYRAATQRFIDGLRRAAAAGEAVEFH